MARFLHFRMALYIIGKWQDDPDQLFKLGSTVFNGSHVVAIKVAKRGPLGTVPE